MEVERVKSGPLVNLSKRERQVMTALYAEYPATVNELLDRMDDPPSYSSVRATLRVLEEKGQVRHEAEGRRYVYSPAVESESARRAALRELVRTFFDGSAERAAAALLGMTDARLTPERLERLADAVEQAREEGR